MSILDDLRGFRDDWREFTEGWDEMTLKHKLILFFCIALAVNALVVMFMSFLAEPEIVNEVLPVQTTPY